MDIKVKALAWKARDLWFDYRPWHILIFSIIPVNSKMYLFATLVARKLLNVYKKIYMICLFGDAKYLLN